MNLDLNEQKLTYIINVLGERPYREVAALLVEIQGQINAQTTDGIGGTDVTQLRTASGDKD